MKPHTIVLVPGSPAWRAVYAALDQFVVNGDDAVDLGDTCPHLEEGRAVLEQCNAAIAQLADDVEGGAQ